VKKSSLSFAVLVILIPITLTLKLVFGPTLIFGDNPLQVPGISSDSPLYSWSSTNFGTDVRQGLFSVRDSFLLIISPNSHIFYLLSYMLPLLLILPNYYLFLTKLKFHNRWIKLAGSLLAFANPVVIGDFSKAQTFWVYLALPWVVFYITKILFFMDLKINNFVLLAIFAFFAFGFLPPIILPMLVIYSFYSLILVIDLLSNTDQRIQLIKQLLIGLFICIVTFSLLALPYIIIAPAGQKAFLPTTLLGDYYNDYSTTYFSNILRLAGNNGNAASILNYNKFELINSLGYVPFIVIIYPFTKLKKISILLLTLLSSMLVVFVFLNLLSINVTFGTTLFNSQFVASTIRDPAKIFEVILPLYVLAFTYSLQKCIKSLSNVSSRLIITVCMLAILLYAWPIFSGDLGILINRSESISTYTAETNISNIVNDTKNDSLRSIILPSNHRDELNYQSTSQSLTNGLRLGGSLPSTDLLTQQLQNSIDGDGYLRQVLNIASINNVYLNTVNVSKQSQFGLINTSQNLSSTESTLKGSTDYSNRLGANIIKYVNKKAYNLIVSGGKSVEVSNSASLHQILPLTKSNYVLSGLNLDSGIFTSYYSTIYPKNNSFIKIGYAQLTAPQLIRLSYVVSSNNTQRLLSVYNTNPVTASKQLVLRQPLSNNDTQLILDGIPISLANQGGKFSLRSGEHYVSTGYETELNTANEDTAFDYNSSVIDASDSRIGEPKIQSAIVRDHLQGSGALEVSTRSHVALITKRIPAPDTNTYYKISFHYKNLSGEHPSFGIYQGNKLIDAAQSELNGKNNTWESYSQYFSLNGIKKYFDVNIYLDSLNGEKSESIFDDMQIYKVSPDHVSNIKINNYSPDYNLNNYTYHTGMKSNANLINNGSFNNPDLWGAVGDATINAPGDASFYAKQSNNAFKSKHSAMLESNNHTAYITESMSQYDPDKSYSVSFWYKNIKGTQPSFTLWENGINKVLTHTSLTATSKWTNYSYDFVPDPGAKNISVYFYSPSTGKKTINLFDDVSIVAMPDINNYLIRKSSNNVATKDIVKHYSRISPDELALQNKVGNGVVMFNESYHEGWRAYITYANAPKQNIFQKMMFIKPGFEISPRSHALLNGYANAWVINSKSIPAKYVKNGKYQMVLEYWPEREYLDSFVISCTLLSCLVIYFGYSYKNNISKNKR
jgi:hypothetical protein